jgi:hypothetical protein
MIRDTPAGCMHPLCHVMSCPVVSCPVVDRLFLARAPERASFVEFARSSSAACSVRGVDTAYAGSVYGIAHGGRTATHRCVRTRAGEGE